MTFHECLMQCAGTPELVSQFNRLSGCSLGRDSRSAIDKMIDKATGYQDEIDQNNNDDMRKFINFVWDCVWLRLPPAATDTKESK